MIGSQQNVEPDKQGSGCYHACKLGGLEAYKHNARASDN